MWCSIGVVFGVVLRDVGVIVSMTNDERMAQFKCELPEKFYNKLEDSIRIILKHVDDVEEIDLFGSCARGDMRWDSDIDLAVITENKIEKPEIRGMVIDILDEPSILGVKADVIFRTKDMVDMSDTFRTLFYEDRRVVWVRD